MIDRFNKSLMVQVHPLVLEREWVGLVRHHAEGNWEFHCTLDSLGEKLVTVPLTQLTGLDPTLRELETLPPWSQAWRWEAGEEFQTSHLPIGPTFFFEIQAVPTSDNPDNGEITGACINCWVRIQTPEAAEDLVTRKLSDEDWRIESIFGPEVHTAEDYQTDPTGVEFFQQAQLDGDVFVFHVYEKEDS